MSFLVFVSDFIAFSTNYTWQEGSESQYFLFCSFFIWWNGLKNCFYVTSCWRLIPFGFRDILNATIGDRKIAAGFQAYPPGLSPKFDIACFPLNLLELVATLASSRTFNLVFSLFVVVVDDDFFVNKNRDTATWRHRKDVRKIQVQVRKTNLLFHLFNKLLLSAYYVPSIGAIR